MVFVNKFRKLKLYHSKLIKRLWFNKLEVYLHPFSKENEIILYKLINKNVTLCTQL